MKRRPRIYYSATMTAGGSSGTSGTSEACLAVPFGVCPDGTKALAAFGPGVLAPITLTVNSGDDLQLSVSVEATATANSVIAPEGANPGITVDPLFLTLPSGARFDSGVPGFLSGLPSLPPPSSAPEPNSLLLVAAALLSLCALRRDLA